MEFKFFDRSIKIINIVCKIPWYKILPKITACLEKTWLLWKISAMKVKNLIMQTRNFECVNKNLVVWSKTCASNMGEQTKNLAVQTKNLGRGNDLLIYCNNDVDKNPDLIEKRASKYYENKIRKTYQSMAQETLTDLGPFFIVVSLELLFLVRVLWTCHPISRPIALVGGGGSGVVR